MDINVKSHQFDKETTFKAKSVSFKKESSGIRVKVIIQDSENIEGNLDFVINDVDVKDQPRQKIVK